MSPTKPSDRELWVEAVEMWLHHIENNYVENVLLAALAANLNNVDATIDWLIQNKYIGPIGNYGFGAPKGLGIDVGGNAKAGDFIQVFWSNERVMNISLKEALNYLRNGKKRNEQLNLMELGF